MIPELGQLCLVIAMCLAVAQGVVPLFGAYRESPGLMAVAKPAAHGQLAFLLLAFVFLAIAFQQDDFSVLYVASNSNTELPEIYKFAAVWGAHEGSLLLWALIMAVWTSAVAVFSKTLPADVVARVLARHGLYRRRLYAVHPVYLEPVRTHLPDPARWA